MASRPPLIQLCGPLAVEVEGRRVEERLPGRQGKILLAYLALHRSAPSPRERLGEAIWPKGGPAAIDSALSALLSKLRKALEPIEIEGRSMIRMSLPPDSRVDVESAQEAIHRAASAVAMERWPEAWAPARIALHTSIREFLPDEDALWIDQQRRELEDIQLRALECVAAVGFALGGPELAAAERAGRSLVKLAPLRESGYLQLMEALARRGNVAEALLVYEELRGELRDELGITPGEHARAIHRALLERRRA